MRRRARRIVYLGTVPVGAKMLVHQSTRRSFGWLRPEVAPCSPWEEDDRFRFTQRAACSQRLQATGRMDSDSKLQTVETTHLLTDVPDVPAFQNQEPRKTQQKDALH